MRPSPPLTLVVAAAASLALALPAAAGPPAANAKGLPATAVAEINALAQAKLSRTPVQRKIDSRLLTADKLRRHVPLAAGVGRVATDVTVDPAGRTTVDIKATVTKDLLARLTSLGGSAREVQPKYGAIRADVPLAAIEALAATPGVSRVAVARSYLTMGAGKAPTPPSIQERAAALRKRLAGALRGGRIGATTPAAAIGAVTSEGDVAHAADTTRARRRVSGVGVKVGVLSDGVASLHASIVAGDLPPDVTVLPGQAGDGDEGTAMLEIVHDLAPKAQLAFATGVNGLESFAENIRALRAAGCDIIVDDVLYFAEPAFQDGPVAQAVIDVTNDGALYFASAGNASNLDDGTAGNWEGDFAGAGPIGKFAGTAHDFDPGAGVQPLNRLAGASLFKPTVLQWNDPAGHSANDYDLYEIDPAGHVMQISNDVQDGDDEPFEAFLTSFNPGGRLVVVKFSGANRYLQLTVFDGRFESGEGLTAFNTPGVLRGHSAVPAAYSVAAVPAHLPFPIPIAPGVPNPAGPFPGAYTKTQQSEVYTSDGPRRVFYHPDGSPITPGNLTATGGTLRAKPDLAAADGVATSVPNFELFYGTSAAAPHAAAIAALVLGANPGITPAEMRAALTGTAIDIEAPGWDRDTGFGIVMPSRALQRTGATPQPFAVAGTPVVTPITGDHDAFLEPGESASVTIPVTNIGDAAAATTKVQLTATTPGVTVTPALRNYGRIPAGATTTGAPFTVQVPATHEPGAPITLHAKVTFVGAYSPQVKDAQILTGQPSDTVVDAVYTGPPVDIPDSSPAGVDATVSVSGVGRLARISFSIDGTECTTARGATTVGLNHSFVQDLVATLISPSGASVVLFARRGGTGDRSGENICQAVFTDSAARSITSARREDAPYTGQWAPEEPLSTLLGRNADGTWTFHVADNMLADRGTIRAFSLHLSGFVQATA